MYIKVHGSVSHNCSSVGSPAVTLVKGKVLPRVSKDVKLECVQPCHVGLKLWTIHQENLY